MQMFPAKLVLSFKESRRYHPYTCDLQSTALTVSIESVNNITAVTLSGLDISYAYAAGLTQELLHLNLDKGTDIRCSNWEVCPLSAEQKAYAANDAYAAVKVYQVCRADPP